MINVRKLVLLMALLLLRAVKALLDWVDRRPHIDEPITEGDPGGRYVPQAPPVLRVLPGGEE
jgi:hypothetical protein